MKTAKAIASTLVLWSLWPLSALTVQGVYLSRQIDAHNEAGTLLQQETALLELQVKKLQELRGGRQHVLELMSVIDDLQDTGNGAFALLKLMAQTGEGLNLQELHYSDETFTLYGHILDAEALPALASALEDGHFYLSDKDSTYQVDADHRFTLQGRYGGDDEDF